MSFSSKYGEPPKFNTLFLFFCLMSQCGLQNTSSYQVLTVPTSTVGRTDMTNLYGLRFLPFGYGTLKMAISL